MKTPESRIVIVGGGISGLSAAYYLHRKMKQEGLPAAITVVERDTTWGGKIQTDHRQGFVIERGPDSFLSRKRPVMILSEELGLDAEWVPTGPAARKTYMVHQGRLHPMPAGLHLGIPTRWEPFLKTGLLSPLGKLRAIGDLMLPARQSQEDEALGSFLRRRLGHEVVERITEPLLSGIYAGDAYALSLEATFPQFKQLEQEHRSLIKGLKRSQQNQQAVPSSPSKQPKSVFLSFQNGLSSLIDRLITYLQDQQVNLKLATSVEEITKLDTGYRLTLHPQPLNSADKNKTEETVHADAVIMATPAYVTAELLTESPIQQLLQNIRYVSVANVVLVFKAEAAGLHLDGSGFLVPRREGMALTACTWTSSKWPHTAPEGHVLLRAYVGHAKQEEIVNESDETLLRIVQEELKQLTGLDQEPLFWQVNRWHRSMPQYLVGHVERLNKLDKLLPQYYPGFALCGAGYRGVGIPDCIAQGKQAAEQILHFLKSKKE